jgi:LytS/YehU family sensor histidine kinase
MPVLENVFKHGTRFISDEYLIDFRFTIHNNQLVIYSRNNFKSESYSNGMESSGGIGLANLKHRLEILYPKRHEIKTNTEGNTYIVTVEISLK